MMYKWRTHDAVETTYFLIPVLVIPAVALAKEGNGRTVLSHPELDPIAFFASVVYGFLGIALAMCGYKVYSWMVPFDLNKRLRLTKTPQWVWCWAL